MSKVIVFSGHGSWELGKDEYTPLPGKCTIKFYTMNMKTLSDGLGGDIDRGLVSGLEPDQVGNEFTHVPDMRLFPPTGLHIKRPDPNTWHVLELPGPVPVDEKNIQVKINPAFGGGGSLSVLFDVLRPAIAEADSVTFLWAACRAINLKNTGGRRIGVNAMQR